MGRCLERASVQEAVFVWNGWFFASIANISNILSIY